MNQPEQETLYGRTNFHEMEWRRLDTAAPANSLSGANRDVEPGAFVVFSLVPVVLTPPARMQALLRKAAFV